MINTKNAFSALTIVFTLLAMYAGYNATNTHGQTQSGWDMMLFFCMALILICFDDHSWGKTILCIACVGIALVFALHFLGGEAAFHAISHFVQWAGQQLFQRFR